MASDVRWRVVLAAAAAETDMLAQDEGKAGFISRSLTGKPSPSQICSDVCLLGDSKFHQAGNQDQLSHTAYCRHHSLLPECPGVSYRERGEPFTEHLPNRFCPEGSHCLIVKIKHRLVVKINTAHFGQNALAP